MNIRATEFEKWNYVSMEKFAELKLGSCFHTSPWRNINSRLRNEDHHNSGERCSGSKDFSSRTSPLCEENQADSENHSESGDAE